MIRVVVVDDQVMIRDALAMLLDLEDTVTVVGCAGSGDEALSVVTELDGKVDVVITDVEMPGLDGITSCAAIRYRFPHIRVLMVTAFARPGYVQKALEAGATGYLVKDSPLPRLIDAIHRVAKGERVIDPDLAVQTLTLGQSPLTERETEVLTVLRDGVSVDEAAVTLGIGAGTLRNYVSNAIDKTGAKNRNEAIRLAEARGWLDPGSPTP